MSSDNTSRGKSDKQLMQAVGHYFSGGGSSLLCRAPWWRSSRSEFLVVMHIVPLGLGLFGVFLAD
jgi:hypothetical protein